MKIIFDVGAVMTHRRRWIFSASVQINGCSETIVFDDSRRRANGSVAISENAQ